MTEPEVSQLVARLDILVRLDALNLVAGKKQGEQIALLSAAGLAPKEIAEILETTPNTVRVRLSNFRKQKKGATHGKTKRKQT
ncbi:MAG: hypothetical protein IH936_09835 [Acidobacteria bacterium]|nr:hypothetical protein [Acidobacteriota bacterium]